MEINFTVTKPPNCLCRISTFPPHADLHRVENEKEVVGIWHHDVLSCDFWHFCYL